MTKRPLRRGVTLRGEILRVARMEHGLKQIDLAVLAGVGERTVRKAESGETVERYIAEYLCTALSLSLADVIKPAIERQHRSRIDRLLYEFDQAVGDAVLFDKSDALLSMLAATSVWYSTATPIPKASGAWCGRDEIRRYCRIVHRWINERRYSEREVSYCNQVLENTVVYARGVVTLSSGAGEFSHSDAFRSIKLLVVDCEGIQVVEHSFFPFQPERLK